MLETVAIQDTQHRVFLFIQYLDPDETRPETRKRQKKWADLREAKVGEPLRGAVEDFFDLGFAATIKNLYLSMACLVFSISSGKLDIFMVLPILHEFWISWKPSDYSGLFQVQAIDPPSPSHAITQ